MRKALELKGHSTITTAKTQDNNETPKSSRSGGNKGQRETRSSTDPEDYTTLPLLLVEEEGSGIRIQKQKRTRTKSDTKTKRKENTTHHTGKTQQMQKES